MDSHSCEGDSEPERSLKDDPRFRKLNELLRRMPQDRQQAALDQMRNDDGKETEDASDAE